MLARPGAGGFLSCDDRRTGELERLAFYVGQIAGAIVTNPSADARVEEMVRSARVALDRI
jgi:hypothetical protein